MTRLKIAAALVLMSTLAARADNLADCQQTGDLTKAIGACTALLKETSVPADKASMAYGSLSNAYVQQKDLTKALDFAWKAITVAPKDAANWGRHGKLHAALGHTLRGAASYTEAIKLDPKNADYYIARGDLFRRLGALPKAISDATEALKLKPDSAEAYANRGYAEFRLGEGDKAAADADEALKHDAKQPTGHLIKGLIAVTKKDTATAMTEIKRSLELDGTNQVAKDALAQLEKMSAMPAPAMAPKAAPAPAPSTTTAPAPSMPPMTGTVTTPPAKK